MANIHVVRMKRKSTVTKLGVLKNITQNCVQSLGAGNGCNKTLSSRSKAAQCSMPSRPHLKLCGFIHLVLHHHCLSFSFLWCLNMLFQWYSDCSSLAPTKRFETHWLTESSLGGDRILNGTNCIWEGLWKGNRSVDYSFFYNILSFRSGFRITVLLFCFCFGI